MMDTTSHGNLVATIPQQLPKLCHWVTRNRFEVAEPQEGCRESDYQEKGRVVRSERKTPTPDRQCRRVWLK